MASPARSRQAARCFAALTTFVLATLLARPASANSAMGLAGLAELVFLAIGVAGLVLSGVLGGLAWWTALRPPTAVGLIFARGFLGVSAVVSFAIASLCLAIGLGDWLKSATSLVLGMIAVLAIAFLAIEFVIAGKLYGRSHAHRPSTLAQVLRVASFALAGLFSLVGALTLVFVLIEQLAPSTPGPSSEVRGYERGCKNGDSSDCNMLGLRLRSGDVGLPRDAQRAASSFERACDLGASIGCKNLAQMYREGDGIEPNAELSKSFYERASELDAKSKR